MNDWRDRVHRTPRAEQDIEEQVEYYLVVAGEPGVAERFSSSIEEALASIALHPEAGASYPSSSPPLEELRWWPIRGFPDQLIFYRLVGDRVEVIRVLHGARDLRALLRDEE